MSQTDRIAIGIYRDPKALGIYAVAASMIIFVTVILRSVNQIFAPIVSDLQRASSPGARAHVPDSDQMDSGLPSPWQRS